MKKREFSIRYKILILMTLIPLFALGIYVAVALQVFKDDKVAYVFDSSSNLSATLGNQLKIQLSSVLNISSSLFQDFALKGQFTEFSQKLFDHESEIEAVVVFKKGAQEAQLSRQGLLEKSPGLFDSEWLKWGVQSEILLNEAVQKKRVVRNRPQSDRLLLLESSVDKTRNETYVFVVILQATEMQSIFAKGKSLQAFLMDSKGKIIFGPSELEGQNITETIPLKFLSDETQTVGQGAETVKDGEGKDLLVSFSRVGFSDLYIMTSVNKEKALSATQILVRKSFIFFVVMISFTAILSLLASHQLTQALTSLFKATQKVSEGDFTFKVNIKSNDEIGTLAENFNTMAEEVSRLLSQTAEKARMENELQTAKTVQETLFPETTSQIGPLEISGYYEPASECGGDWWHYCRVGDQVLLWIGDATGHGAPAALITSAAKSASAIIERLNVTPAQALELLNRCIYDVSKGKIMMTFFLASYDLKNSTLTYANASHEAPFLIQATPEPLKKKGLIPLNEVNSPRLGQSRDSKYQQTTISLKPGDLIFFYTDGLQDIRNSKNEAWGEREFIKSLVQSHRDYPAAKVSTGRMVETFQAYRQGTQLVDDVTFFVVKNGVQGIQ